ncbi:MAG: hypothetical protein RR808_06120 [Akkermansia sp.]
MIDFLGVTENWSAIQNIPWTQRWTFSDDSTGAPISLDGVTFTGRIHLEGKPEPINLDIQKSAIPSETNILLISCQGLPEGRHPYEIYSISESGNQNRLISGYIGVIQQIDNLIDEAKSYTSRTLSIRLPNTIAKQIKLEWLSSTSASLSAQEAWAWYEKTKTLSDSMLDVASKAQDAVTKLAEIDNNITLAKNAATKAQTSATEAEKWAKDASKKGTDGTNGQDGKNGADGQNGENGKTPIIKYTDTTINGIHYLGNYWYIWALNPLTNIEEYTFTTIQAEGKNGQNGQPGINGDTIKRLYIPTETDLPTIGSTGTIYYIPTTTPGQYTTYLWLTKPDKTSSWTKVGETDIDHSQYANKDMANITASASDYDTNYPDNYITRLSYIKRAISSAINNAITTLTRVATTNLLGMVKLSTPTTITTDNYAAVGLNNQKQLGIPQGTTNSHGTFRTTTSTTLDITNSGVIGTMNDGGLMAAQGNASYYGVAKYTNTKSVELGTNIDTAPNGQLKVKAAGYCDYGVVCFGTNKRLTLNNVPHVITIAKCDGITTYNQEAGNIENSICINLATNGTLKFDNKGPNQPNTGNSLWLDIDNSLHITPSKQLSITRYTDIIFNDTYATTTTGGIIKIGDTLTIDPATGTLNLKEKTYITASMLEAKGYITKTTHDQDLQQKVSCAGGITKLALTTEEAYATLPVKDASTLYLCY